MPAPFGRRQSRVAGCLKHQAFPPGPPPWVSIMDPLVSSHAKQPQTLCLSHICFAPSSQTWCSTDNNLCSQLSWKRKGTNTGDPCLPITLGPGCSHFLPSLLLVCTLGSDARHPPPTCSTWWAWTKISFRHHPHHSPLPVLSQGNSFCLFVCLFVFNAFIFIFFLVMLGLCCCAGFSLVVASRDYSSSQCKGFSFRGLLLLGSMGSSTLRLP